jgi:hypothetical protein
MEQQIKIKNVMSYEDNKLRMPEISRATEPDLSRGWSVIGSRDSGRSNKINRHKRFRSV